MQNAADVTELVALFKAGARHIRLTGKHIPKVTDDNPPTAGTLSITLTDPSVTVQTPVNYVDDGET